MAVVAIMPHHFRPQALELAADTLRWLTAQGHEGRVPDDDALAAGLEEWSCPLEKVTSGLDLAVSIGGDGTMLRTVDRVLGSGAAMLGVNVGAHLGYLAEVEPQDLRASIERFLAGDYTIEERMTLEVVVESGGAARVALNEAVLEKTLPGHTVRLGVSINERPFTTYAADGLIVATPTGSTAYNLSVRGPIVSPRQHAVLLTPVSPHMLFDRTLVLHPSESVRVEVLDGPTAVLVVDGRSVGPMVPGDAVVCRAGARDARMVTFGGRDFHRILKTKFKLSDR